MHNKNKGNTGFDCEDLIFNVKNTFSSAENNPISTEGRDTYFIDETDLYTFIEHANKFFFTAQPQMELFFSIRNLISNQARKLMELILMYL